MTPPPLKKVTPPLKKQHWRRSQPPLRNTSLKQLKKNETPHIKPRALYAVRLSTTEWQWHNTQRNIHMHIHTCTHARTHTHIWADMEWHGICRI